MSKRGGRGSRKKKHERTRRKIEGRQARKSNMRKSCSSKNCTNTATVNSDKCGDCIRPRVRSYGGYGYY